MQPHYTIEYIRLPSAELNVEKLVSDHYPIQRSLSPLLGFIGYHVRNVRVPFNMTTELVCVQTTNVGQDAAKKT